jgi:hypothetical protein
MGYYVSQQRARFHISADQINQAFQACKEFGTEHELSWVNQTAVEGTENLKDCLYEMRWEISLDKKGNVDHICFEGDKASDQDRVLEILAPFVKHGSYIEMLGEEGELWRYQFHDGLMEEIYPTITWEEF